MADKTGTVGISVSSGITLGTAGITHTKAVAVGAAGTFTLTTKGRRLPYVNGMWHTRALATKPGGVSAPKIIMIPEGVKDFTLYVKGSTANTCKVYKSVDSASEIFTGTPTWRQVHATLDSVGTTMVRYVLGNRLPMALKLECLVNNATAKMIVLGKWA